MKMPSKPVLAIVGAILCTGCGDDGSASKLESKRPSPRIQIQKNLQGHPSDSASKGAQEKIDVVNQCFSAVENRIEKGRGFSAYRKLQALKKEELNPKQTERLAKLEKEASFHAAFEILSSIERNTGRGYHGSTRATFKSFDKYLKLSGKSIELFHFRGQQLSQDLIDQTIAESDQKIANARAVNSSNN